MKNLSNNKAILNYSMKVGEIFYNIINEYREDRLIYNDNGDLIDNYKIFIPTLKEQIQDTETYLKELENDQYREEEVIDIVKQSLEKYKNASIYDELLKLEELLGNTKFVKETFNYEEIIEFRNILSIFNKNDALNKDRLIHIFCKGEIENKEYTEKAINMYVSCVEDIY